MLTSASRWWMKWKHGCMCEATDLKTVCITLACSPLLKKYSVAPRHVKFLKFYVFTSVFPAMSAVERNEIKLQNTWRKCDSNEKKNIQPESKINSIFLS